MDKQDGLFSNSGEKIQTIAIVFMVVQLIIVFILGLVAMDGNAAWLGFLVWIGGGLGSYVSGVLLFGYGKIVECQEELTKDVNQIQEDVSKIIKETNKKETEILKMI